MCSHCSICQQPSSDKNVQALPFASIPCGHVYHFACISQWLQVVKSCPSCRAVCSADKVVRLYLECSPSSTAGCPTKEFPRKSQECAALKSELDKMKTELKNVKRERSIFLSDRIIAQTDLRAARQETEKIKAECKEWEEHARFYEHENDVHRIEINTLQEENWDLLKEKWNQRDKYWDLLSVKWKLQRENRSLEDKIRRWKQQTGDLEREMGQALYG